MFKEAVQREYDVVEDYSDVRLFTVGLVQTRSPLYDLQDVRQNWTRPSRGEFYDNINTDPTIYKRSLLLQTPRI